MSPAKNPHFFLRQTDGTVRLRLKFTAEEASWIEVAAGSMPLMTWVIRTVVDRARAEYDAEMRRLASIPPPEDAP